MRRNMKGFIAKLLVLCMVVGLLPVIALAAETSASVGRNNTYKVLGDAADIYHVSGDTYALRNDTSLGGAYHISSDTTLKLNDHYFTIPDTATIRVSAKLTIEGPGKIGTSASQRSGRMLRAASNSTDKFATFFVESNKELSLGNVTSAYFAVAGTGKVNLTGTKADITVQPDGSGQTPKIVADTASTVTATAAQGYVAVTFDANGGKLNSEGTDVDTLILTGKVENGSATITFPSNPARSNYTFKGWFNAKTGGSKVTAPTFSQDTVLYAQWDYTGGGSGDTPSGGGSSGGGGGGSGSSSSTTVSSGKTANGSFTISDKNAESGDTVKITPKADKGYVVDQVTVKDKNGGTVAVTENSDGTFSFVMPDKKLLPVTVNVTFKQEPVTGIFTDVPADAWYAEAVKYVSENGLMSGVGDGKFAPDTITTRAMVVTVLYRIEGEPSIGAGGKFADVASGQWYSNAVEWAAANGIVDGYGNGKFGPNDTMTREQMAVVMYRYAKFKGLVSDVAADLTGYTDAGQVSSWALDAMKWANGKSLITGTSTTTLSPDGSATRAQLATILMRYCENVVKK